MDNFKIIAHIENGFDSKFGIPRQSGIAGNIISKIVFEKEFRDINALRGIEEYSHLWLIWKFSENERSFFSPTVRPPRLGGNERVGVFATRSPFRPNPIGLSSVELVKVENSKQLGPVLFVKGADLMNGTPIYDIKPYVAYSDCHSDANCSFADEFKDYHLEVEIDDIIINSIDNSLIGDIIELLKTDPRPSYHKNDERIYGVKYSGLDIRFKVKDGVITVTEVIK